MMEVAQGIAGLVLMGWAVRTSHRSSCDTAMHWRVLNAALGALGVWCLLSAASAMVPVVVEVRARIIGSAPQSVDVHLVGDKVRACRYMDIQAQVVHDGVAHDAAAQWLDDPSPGSSRPLGMQSFGVARVTWAGAEHPQEAVLIVQHDCGGWWRTRTEIARIALP